MRRALVLFAALAGLSVVDVVLTVMGLEAVPGAREVNPLPALAFGHGVAAAVALKVAALGLVFVVVVVLARAPRYEPAVRALVAAWCVVLGLVDGFSFVQLARAGVFG